MAVSPDILKRYVGVYARVPANPRKVDVKFADGHLVMLIKDIPEPLRLTPLSERLFASAYGFAYDFVASDAGQATAVVEIHVTGNYEFARQR